MKSFLFALFFVALTAAAHAQSKVLTVADFETGDVSQLPTQKALDDSISIVTTPVRAGKHAAKTLLRASDPEVSNGQRAEFSDGKKITPVEMERTTGMG